MSHVTGPTQEPYGNAAFGKMAGGAGSIGHREGALLPLELVVTALERDAPAVTTFPEEPPPPFAVVHVRVVPPTAEMHRKGNARPTMRLRRVRPNANPIRRERRWSREFGTAKGVTIISRLMDDNAMISIHALASDGSTWPPA